MTDNTQTTKTAIQEIGEEEITQGLRVLYFAQLAYPEQYKVFVNQIESEQTPWDLSNPRFRRELWWWSSQLVQRNIQDPEATLKGVVPRETVEGAKRLIESIRPPLEHDYHQFSSSLVSAYVNNLKKQAIENDSGLQQLREEIEEITVSAKPRDFQNKIQEKLHDDARTRGVKEIEEVVDTTISEAYQAEPELLYRVSVKPTPEHVKEIEKTVLTTNTRRPAEVAQMITYFEIERPELSLQQGAEMAKTLVDVSTTINETQDVPSSWRNEQNKDPYFFRSFASNTTMDAAKRADKKLGELTTEERDIVAGRIVAGGIYESVTDPKSARRLFGRNFESNMLRNRLLAESKQVLNQPIKTSSSSRRDLIRHLSGQALLGIGKPDASPLVFTLFLANAQKRYGAPLPSFLQDSLNNTTTAGGNNIRTFDTASYSKLFNPLVVASGNINTTIVIEQGITTFVNITTYTTQASVPMPRMSTRGGGGGSLAGGAASLVTGLALKSNMGAAAVTVGSKILGSLGRNRNTMNGVSIDFGENWFVGALVGIFVGLSLLLGQDYIIKKTPFNTNGNKDRVMCIPVEGSPGMSTIIVDGVTSIIATDVCLELLSNRPVVFVDCVANPGAPECQYTPCVPRPGHEKDDCKMPLDCINACITQLPMGSYSHGPFGEDAVDISGCGPSVGVNANHEGTVAFVGIQKGYEAYGNTVVIQSVDGSYQTIYAHLGAVSVTQGQTVSQNTHIGMSDNSGNSSGSHLHFELVQKSDNAHQGVYRSNRGSSAVLGLIPQRAPRCK